MKKAVSIVVTVLALGAFVAATQAEARGRHGGGCGSHGGPGYRKANGKCASWRD